MRKITAMILTLMMCVSFIIPVGAASGTSFTIGGATAYVGDTIDLPVTFTSDVKVKAIKLSFEYDTNVLEFVDFVNCGEEFSTEPLFNTYDKNNKNISLGWSKAQDFSAGVKVCDARFRAIKKGDIKVTGNPSVKDETGNADVSCANPEAQIKINSKFTVDSVVVPGAQTANLGDKVSDVIADLNVLPITVKGAAADDEGTLNATGWTCADVTTETFEEAKEYTFTGSLVGNEGTIVPDDKKSVSVKVNVGKIDLSTDTAVTTTAPTETTEMLSKTDATKAGTAIAAALPTKVEISKDGKYKEEATVAWTVKSGSKTELDLTKLTSEVPDNIVTLEGTITPSASGNYKNTKTVECVAKVVPAEITGSKFSVDNAAQYGNATVTFTIPGAEVNGKKVTAYMYTKLKDGKVDESSLIAKSAKSTDAISAEVSSEKGVTPVTYKDYTGTIQFDSFDTLGLSTNDVFYVVLKVDTATVKNGEDMYVESYVLPETNRRPGSGNSGNNGTVTVKKYDIKVSEGTNGTATVDKDAKAGDTVKVDVKPNDGYKVKEIIVKTADGKTVEVDQKNRTFVMPEGNVTVEVVYEEGTDEPSVVDGKFTDVPDTFWAAADIYTLKEAGIINGKSDKEFDPEGKVTRAEFTKMIVNLFGVKASSNTVSFTDCKADDWFTPFVAAAVEAGYVKGITDTEFAPDQTITREEACTILGRAYAQTSDKALNFTDASDIADFASAYVALLVDMGYVNGYTDGTFLPKNEITRAEAAKIIAGAFRAAEKAKTEVNDNENAEVKADADAEVKTDANADAKTDAKADNGETAEK